MKELVKKLGYVDSAQIMTIKGCMPRDVYGLCLTKATLEELREFLMDLFSNPRMKKATSVNSPGEVSAFSMGQYADTAVVSATPPDIGKIKQDISNLQYNVQKMSTAGPRNRIQNKLWKPEVTPPRRRGGSSRGNFRGGRTDFQNRQNRLRHQTMGMETGTSSPKVNLMETIPTEGKEIHLEGTLGVEVEADMTIVLMLGDQE